MSAVASVTIGAITVTGMRRAVAAATSMSEGVIFIEAIARRRVARGDDVAVDLVVQQAEQDVELRHPREQLVLGDLVQRCRD